MVCFVFVQLGYLYRLIQLRFKFLEALIGAAEEAV